MANSLPDEITKVLARDPAVLVRFKRLQEPQQKRYTEWVSAARRSNVRKMRAEHLYQILSESDGGGQPSTYDGKSLISKLGFTIGMQGRAVNAPMNYMQLLAGDTTNITFLQDDQYNMDFVHVFCMTLKTLQDALKHFDPLIKDKGMLWISWPKKSSGLECEIDGNVIRDVVSGTGWVDVKVCSIDETWSGLQLRRRVNS